MTSPIAEIVEMVNRQSSTPSLLECIQMRNWQKAIDIIAADNKSVYEQKLHNSGWRRDINPVNDNNNDAHGTGHLAIHELCKIITSPTSVRFSKDEISDDEEDDDEDDEFNEDDAAEELDQIFDACELEEGTKMYEVTQFMIDASHSMGPVRFARPCDDDAETDNNNSSNINVIQADHHRRGVERQDSRGLENDETGNHRQQEAENDGSASHDTSAGDRFAVHKSILTWTDSMGKTPLHILCENSCDSNMMRVILGSTYEATGNPQAPSALSLILAKDSRGSTPLHYLAYSRQCPFSSLKLMMEYCKPRTTDSENGTESSRWIDPTQCTDDDGETPLHWSLAGYVSSRRIKELTRYSLRAIMVQNEKGERPFDQFTANFVDSDWTDHDVCGHEYWENIQEYLRVIYDNQTNNQHLNMLNISEMNDQQKMNGVYYEDRGNTSHQVNEIFETCTDSKWLPLHFLAGSSYDFPPIFMDLALKYCTDDLRKADKNGMLPLHLACGRQSANKSNNSINNHKNGTTSTTDTEKAVNSITDLLSLKILKKFQRASLIQVPSNKRLALHFAVETQKPLSLVAALIRTYPRSLNIPDPVTKLWPYALVGVTQSADENSSNESLSVSFALLRADPSVLHLVRKIQHIGNLTDKEKSRSKVDSRWNTEEDTKTAEESYMEHSSRRIRRLTIRGD